MLQLQTGGRLHFGLMELASGEPHRYGGLGMMIQQPSLQVCLHESHEALIGSQQTHDAQLLQRIELVKRLTTSSLTDAMEPWLNACAIELLDCPPMHSGLGVGTQLAAAVATLFERRYVLETTGVVPGLASIDKATHVERAIARLAQLSGRGKRSAIGLHGFLKGGLIKDLGHDGIYNGGSTDNARRVHTTSTPMPEHWRIVLITSVCTGDMCGVQEDRLIDRAGAQPNPDRWLMLELADQCIRAAGEADFVTFTQSLEQYMELASRLFASVQAGRYRDLSTNQRVKLMQQAGLAAVGQSSWGPTVFGFSQGYDSAAAAAETLRHQLHNEPVRVLITAPLNHGARWLHVASEPNEASRIATC